MAKTERSGHTTTNHDFIRQWVEERGGWPARVAGTESDNDAGLIRIDFPGFSGEGSLEQIEWDEWFESFESNQLAFLHRDMDHGGGDLDRFNKLISRSDDDDDSEGADGGRSGGRGRASGGAAKSARGGAKSGSGTAAKSAPARKTAKTASSRTAGDGATAESGAKPAGRGRAGGGEAGTELRGLLLHELGDLLSAERQFLVTTRVLAREALEPEVRERAEEHVTETEGQIQRLNEAFAALGERPRAVKCEAAQGLKEEHDSYKSEEKPSRQLLSAFGLGSGLRVEHYEIASYRSAIALAGALGEKECADLLNESLREEMAMAAFLEKTSRTLLRRMATEEAAGEREGRSSSRGGSGAKNASSRGGSAASKLATAKSATAKSAAKRGSSGGGGSKAGGSSGRGGGGRSRG